MILSRLLCLLGSGLGLLSTIMPWWVLTWKWQGGAFETRTFLHANSISGDLSDLGLTSPLALNTSAYDFAQTVLSMITIAVITGILAAIARGTWQRRLSIFSSLLLSASAIVFVLSLSSTLSKQGRSIFSSLTLTFQGSTSTVTSGLTSGFYLVIGAVFIMLASYMIQRRHTIKLSQSSAPRFLHQQQ